jgi:hypothetical protein
MVGFLVAEPDIVIDLLGDVSDARAPISAARRLAKTKFAEQLQKHGLPPSTVRTASLHIHRGVSEAGVAGNGWRSGFRVGFHVLVLTDTDYSYEREQVVFVAPHDPRFERRSARATA